MTIREAIETLADLNSTLPQCSPEERRQAVNLGIQALKNIMRHRSGFPSYVVVPLPGETNE